MIARLQLELLSPETEAELARIFDPELVENILRELPPEDPELEVPWGSVAVH